MRSVRSTGSKGTSIIATAALLSAVHVGCARDVTPARDSDQPVGVRDPDAGAIQRDANTSTDASESMSTSSGGTSNGAGGAAAADGGRASGGARATDASLTDASAGASNEADADAAPDAHDGPRGEVTGKAGRCTWEDEHGCSAGCFDDPSRKIEADCNGPNGGPQKCRCKLNGQFLWDEAVYFTTHDMNQQWRASSCMDVATQLAAGKCFDILNCCVDSWYEPSPRASTEACECMADPSLAGFESCEALAAARREGIIVQTCADYGPPYTPP